METLKVHLVCIKLSRLAAMQEVADSTQHRSDDRIVAYTSSAPYRPLSLVCGLHHLLLARLRSAAVR